MLKPIKHLFILAGTCLLFVLDAPATVFNPAKVVIVKADDFKVSTTGWTNFLNSSRNLGIKVSIGVIVEDTVGNATTATYMQQQQAIGDVEFWNHGWDHTNWMVGATTVYEFKGSGLAYQQTHFSDAQAGLLTATGQNAVAFGPGFNAYDADTVAIMNNTPAMRLLFASNASTARSWGLAERIATVGIITESGGVGNPVAATFISNNPNGPAGPVSLQFHPLGFTAADLAEYVQIVQFLQGKGYTFMLPAEYIAALDGTAPAGAKIWTGATDANWTTAANWSPSGAPASGNDVAFDSPGTNLASNFNGTARSVNSLTFTSGQSAQVTITTTNTAPFTLAPTGALGAWTTLKVAAGSHRFTGSDGGSAALADFRFGGANGTTHVLNIGGSTVFEIKGRIDNNTTNTKTFQKTGTGTLVLSGNSGGSGAWNHSSGSGFQIQQGALRFAALNAGGLSSNNYIVSSGAAFELDGNFNQTINNGTYTLNGTGIGGTGTLRSLSGTKSITGSGTGGVNLASHASIGVDEGNLTIAQVVKGPGSLTKVGPGTLTLSGGNTYTGATIVSGGTVALGASNVLPATQVSLGNAILSAGAGFTETTGRLDITGSATINFGDGSSAIAFADNGDLLDWTGTLNISGTFVSGTSLRFGTDAGGLTAAQFAKITVNGVGGYTLNSLGYLSEAAAVTHYDVYLIAGQSNADGRGTNSELAGALASYAAPQTGVKIFYVNPTNSNPVTPSYNSGWTTLAPGYSVAPGFSGSLPSPNFGFEISLGKALAAKDPERDIAIIKVTRGGTNLHTQWDPAGGDNFMWQTFANKVPEAIAALTASGDTAEIRGMFWHQGESDGGNPTYQSDLAEFIAACRTLTGKPNLPFAIGELERDDITPTVTSRSYQLTAMANVAAADPNTFLASSAGLPTYDGTHFTSAAYITFGERLAKAYHDFMNVTVRTPFESWANDNTITFDGDANADGIADGLTWLLGADNPANNAIPLLPFPAGTNGALEVRFTMRNQASRGNAVLDLQHGTSLGSWTTVAIPEASGSQGGVGFVITPEGNLNHVVATIPSSAAPDGRVFARLSGSEN